MALVPSLKRSLTPSSFGRFITHLSSSESFMNTLLFTQRRGATRGKTNFVVNFVPQQEAWVVERMGKFHSILDPGFNILLPFLDRIKYVQVLKELAIEVPQQGAVTSDNVQLQIDGVLYLRVVDPYKASYGVEDPEYAITQLAQTTMRSEVGKINLDTVFKEREQLNINIVESINKAAEPWGLQCMRYEIRDMTMPIKIQEAMQMQVEAERRKRAAILESEGKREASINIAEGEKRARILASEASMQEKINEAKGKSERLNMKSARRRNFGCSETAEAIQINAQAQATGIKLVSESLNKTGGYDAATLSVAEKYVTAFGQIAKDTNTIIVPSDLANASGMIAQALTVYSELAKKKELFTLPSKQKAIEIKNDGEYSSRHK
ncbi:Stomatin-like protein 2, mitochondrial [Dirofilaria immitis]|nr:Stomatin-like protein 2, mitochondrial [Dirofilaria immitis]